MREGFAAVGGRDAAFELEVAPAIDPWKGWERGVQRPLPASAKALERAGDRISAARAAAHKATNRKVVEHATRRNEAVAKRVEEMKRERKQRRRVRKTRAAGGAAVDPAPVPAAPRPGFAVSRRPARRPAHARDRDGRARLPVGPGPRVARAKGRQRRHDRVAAREDDEPVHGGADRAEARGRRPRDRSRRHETTPSPAIREARARARSAA